MTQEIYRNLAKHLDELPGGFPRTNSGVELRILQKLFSPEDAEQEIKRISEEIINKPVQERIRIAKRLSRKPKFARLTKEKAKYICEICGNKPFIQENGMLFAEAHHILELSKSRVDDPGYMICVCPTCHKVIHYGNEQALNDRKKLKTLNKN